MLFAHAPREALLGGIPDLMRPSNIVHLGPDIFRSVTSCLGEQLVSLLRIIQEVHPDLKWYAADVDANGPLPVPRGEPTPILIGDATALIEIAHRVNQFNSGVFVGVPSRIEKPTFRAGGLWTEDEDAAELGDATIEVRAFDWSYWSIATADPNLAQSIRQRLE